MGKLVCPVCGNPGIGDYYHNNVVCPTCGSDLSVFREIREKDKRNKTGIVLSLVGLVAIVALAAFLTGRIVNQHNTDLVAEKDITISQLQTNVGELIAKIEEIQNADNAKPVQEGAFLYTIRKGDSFCGISRRFYGTEKYYKELAEDNGLDIRTHLSIGQQLLIKNR